MQAFSNIDLLSVAIAIAGIGILGVVVYLNDRKSITNRTVFAFSSAAILWSLFNYLHLQLNDHFLALWFLRIHGLFAVFYTFFLYRLFVIFPEQKYSFGHVHRYFLTPFVIGVSLLTLTPLIFKNINSFTPDGRIAGISVGPAIPIFGLTIFFLVVAGFISLIRKTFSIEHRLERENFILVLTGGTITFILHIIFNLILPGAFNNPRFVPLGAVFIFPFILFTSYAILKNKLFNVKVAGVSILVFALAVVTFAEVVFAGNNIGLLIFRGTVFVLVLAFGILLIRGVLREVEQREYIQMLAKDLSKANSRLRELDQQKSEFISIASHQLRSPLTAIRGYASLILEGSYGKLPAGAEEAVRRIADTGQQMVYSVEDFLNVSRIEQGRIKFEPMTLDLREQLEKVVHELGPVAEKKGIKLTYDFEQNQRYQTKADEGKLRQVFANLIDNSIKYTPKGSVHVNLRRAGNKILTSISDTGVGMSKETLGKLFSKYIRAENASRTNVGGTGLGLYVAKNFVELHGGKIWAESDGEGKGSRFFVELGAG